MWGLEAPGWPLGPTLEGELSVCLPPLEGGRGLGTQLVNVGVALWGIPVVIIDDRLQSRTPTLPVSNRRRLVMAGAQDRQL